jgi:fructose 1,6-bisphosphate aldolase/phosphatase
MKVTVTAIKTDIGGIGGHTRPSDRLIESVRDHVVSYLGRLHRRNKSC